MKRIASLVCSLALCAGLLAGCGGTGAGGGATPTPGPQGTAPVGAATPEPSKVLSGVVNTDGSTSMEKVMEILSEAFMEQNGGVTVNYSGTGSGAGIEAANSGTADIGLASRDLKDSETGLTATVVAKDGIAIVVNPNNPVADLTVEQIARLATGEVDNWKDVGGSDAPVAFIGREAGSGTRDGFESITGTSEQCKYTNELTSTGDVIANVASNPNAIGYASLSAVDETVKAITVGGVAPSEETVLDGTYAVQRNFNFITKADAPLSDAAQAFFDYACSAEAAPLIAKAGAVPVA